jgi:hypothetical protein
MPLMANNRDESWIHDVRGTPAVTPIAAKSLHGRK